MRRCERKPKSGFLTRSDTNQEVQPQKLVRSLKFRFKKKRDCASCAVKTKALVSFAVTAQLICAFVLPIQIVGFLMWRLKFLLPFDCSAC